MPDENPTYLDNDLLRDLYRRNQDLVERAVGRHASSCWGWDDANAITWELAARKLLKFQVPGPKLGTYVLTLGERELKSWLWRTATLCTRNYARAERRYEKHLRRILINANSSEADAIDIDVYRDADLLIYCALAAIGELPPKLKTIVGESVVDGMKPREIATKHRLKPGAVRTRLAKARRSVALRAREIEKTARTGKDSGQ